MRKPKFGIGQSVYLKDDVDYYVACHNSKYDSYGNPRPKAITISSIRIEICDGGEQVFYVSSMITAFLSELSLVSEIPNLVSKKDD